MLRIPEEVKDLFKADNVKKEIVIRIPEAELTLTNEDIYEESFTLKEGIESGSNLTFTGCIASSMTISTVNIPVDVEGMQIEAEMRLPDVLDPIPLFHGSVVKMSNKDQQEKCTQLTCYDKIYTINNTDVTSWYNSLTFPISIRNFRNSFFEYVGVQQSYDSLPNDSFSINKTIEDKVITGERILKCICQINGRYGRINRENIFQYVQLVEGTEALYPRDDLFPSDMLFPSAENALESVSKSHYTKLSFENYQVESIDKVQLVNKEGEIVRSAGNGSNPLTIKDNPLIWGKSGAELASVAQNLYNDVRGLWYIPATVDCIGMPYVECGDFVLMAARTTIVRAYVLTRELNGIDSLKDRYTAKGDKKQPIYTPTIKQQVEANATAIKNETSRAQNSENGLQRGINDVDGKVTRVNQLVATKASIEDLQATNATVGSLNAQVANLGTVVANKANISDLNAVNARINTITAQMITTDNLRSKIGGFSSIYMNTLYVNDIYITGNGGNLPDKVRQWA